MRKQVKTVHRFRIGFVCLLAVCLLSSCQSGRVVEDRESTRPTNAAAQDETTSSASQVAESTLESTTPEETQTVSAGGIDDELSPEEAIAWTEAFGGSWTELESGSACASARADRKWLFRNGVVLTNEELTYETEKLGMATLSIPHMTGLKNKALQEWINARILAIAQGLAERDVPAWRNINLPLMRQKLPTSLSVNAYDVGNCQNVMSLSFHKYADYSSLDGYAGYSDSAHVAIDLTTGDLIGLKQVFADGTDYERLVNDAVMAQLNGMSEGPGFGWYLSMEEMLCAPFQGIRQNQPFSAQDYGLVISFDEQNAEFLGEGYAFDVTIPWTAFGDKVVLYDRYDTVDPFTLYDGTELEKIPARNAILIEDLYSTVDIAGQSIDLSIPAVSGDISPAAAAKIASFCNVDTLSSEAESALESAPKYLKEQVWISFEMYAGQNGGGLISLSRTLRIGITMDNADKTFSGWMKTDAITLDVATGAELTWSDIVPDQAWLVEKAMEQWTGNGLPVDDALEKRISDLVLNSGVMLQDSSLSLYPRQSLGWSPAGTSYPQCLYYDLIAEDAPTDWCRLKPGSWPME